MPNPPDRERATTTVEAVSLAVVLVVMTGAIAASLHAAGGGIGASAVGRIRDAVREDAAPSTPPRRTMAKPAGTRDGAWRDAREQRWSVGQDPPRVSRNDLRLDPVLPDRALWRGLSERTFGEAAGAAPGGAVSVEACLLCIDSGWRRRVSAGISATPRTGKSSPPGMGGEVEAQVSVALAAAEVLANVEHLTGWGSWRADGRLRGAIGAEADGRLAAKVSTSVIDLEARGGAMAGAVARAEARAGVDLLGIAVNGTGRAEGWVGAGARGTIGVRREGGIVAWKVGGGAALGVGGAAEWSGSVDVSKLPSRHRDLVAETITRSASTVLPGFPGVVLAFRTHERGTR